jgi:outer membrane biosynthesis protein TonB
MRGRKASAPQIRIGNASATGDLDKNIIRRYIRRKLPQIRHCYEKELLVKTSLSGTVVVQFQISPGGAVQGASAAGMGDSSVENCVAGAIKSIQFPKPKGGGYVNVRYPFIFQPAGG